VSSLSCLNETCTQTRVTDYLYFYLPKTGADRFFDLITTRDVVLAYSPATHENKCVGLGIHAVRRKDLNGRHSEAAAENCET